MIVYYKTKAKHRNRKNLKVVFIETTRYKSRKAKRQQL